MKKLLILLIFIPLMYVSYRYSGMVNRFYLKGYYNLFYTEDEIVQKSWELYDDGKYEKLESFLNPLLNIYISNNEIKRIAGLNYVKLNDPIRGAELFASSFENGGGESADIIKIIKILFQAGHYGEVVFFYDKNLMRTNVNAAFYYGVSLYHIGRYDESLKSLVYAAENGFIGEEIDYYTGINLEKLGRLTEALAMLKSAHEKNMRNKDIKIALIRVYRKTGDFEMAESLLRKN